MTLILGTNDGVWRFDGGDADRVGLDGKRVLHVATRGGDTIAAVAGEGLFRAGDGDTLLWEGDAHSCAIAPGGTYYIGAEPAMIFRSRDGGATWDRLSAIDDLPTRAEWTFPPPPHEPHVLSIDFPDGDPATVLAGIEVGGVILSEDGGDTWREMNNDVYADVHSVRPHPADPRRLFAVTGAGFYASADGGASWERRMDGIGRGYTIGLAVSTADELIVTATDSPQGMNGRIFVSANAGRDWDRLDGDPLPEAPRRAHVPFFEGGTAWLGGYDGRLLRRNGGWTEVAALPAPINTVAAEGRSSSVMH